MNATANLSLMKRAPMFAGWLLLLLLVAVVAGTRDVFATTAGSIFYAMLFAIGTRLTAPDPQKLAYRLGWAALLAFLLAVACTIVSLMTEGTQEGGPIAAFLVSGFYVSLPALAFASVLAFVPLPGADI